MSVPIRVPETQNARALFLASAGLPVFPCGAGPKRNPRYAVEASKAPLKLHGFKDAATDEATIRGWWSRFPGALPAVPMGAASGLFAVDADIDDATGAATGERTLRGLGCDPSSYPFTARTNSGGVHLFFRWFSDMPRNSTKASNGLVGVDIRSDGGYVIAWQPEILVAARGANDLPPPPASFLQALAIASKADDIAPSSLSGLTQLAASSSADARQVHDCAARSERALKEETTTLRMTPKGGRNHAVNRCGQIVGGGHLMRERVEAEIWAAALANGVASEKAKQTRRRMTSALDAGMRQPRGPANMFVTQISAGNGGG